MLGSPFCSLHVLLPDMTQIQFPSLFFCFVFPPFPLSVLPLFSLPFLDWFPHFFFTSSPFPPPPPHSPIFVHLNLHEHWFWVVGCSLGAALSAAPVIEGTLYVASKQEQTIHRSSRWFSHGRVLYPCCHKKGLLKLVCNVNGVSRTTLHNLLTKDRCEQVFIHLCRQR